VKSNHQSAVYVAVVFLACTNYKLRPKPVLQKSRKSMY